MSAPSHTTGRIRFHRRRAELRPPAPPPAQMLQGSVSVVSPGTERRHLAHTGQGRTRDAGYMNLARTRSGWALAPCPHGAAFSPAVAGTVTAPALPVHLVAAARFQLMAARGLDRIPEADLEEPVVVGSGPVAAGAVLELRRRGAERIRVWTRRATTVLADLPGLDPTADPGPTGLVVEATGHPGRALEIARPGAVVGLLGTPDPGQRVDALAVHRAGVRLVGMHELAGLSAADTGYQDAFDCCTSWLATWADRDVVHAWHRTLPSDRVPGFYSGLLDGHRPAEPFVLWDWSTP